MTLSTSIFNFHIQDLPGPFMETSRFHGAFPQRGAISSQLSGLECSSWAKLSLLIGTIMINAHVFRYIYIYNIYIYTYIHTVYQQKNRIEMKFTATWDLNFTFLLLFVHVLLYTRKHCNLQREAEKCFQDGILTQYLCPDCQHSPTVQPLFGSYSIIHVDGCELLHQLVTLGNYETLRKLNN